MVLQTRTCRKVSEGIEEGTPDVDERIPPSHRKYATARTEKQLLPGEEQWHCMKACGQGAIVTEYGTYHDNAGRRFSHPDVKF